MKLQLALSVDRQDMLPIYYIENERNSCASRSMISNAINKVNKKIKEETAFENIIKKFAT